MIPKRIIQTWKTKEIPREFRSYHKRLRKLNPDYEFLLFTDEEVIDFVENEYPQYFDAFNALPEFICKTDLFRLLAVYKLGGIYLDLDVNPLRSFDDLCEHECVFPSGGPELNAYFAAEFGMLEKIGQYAFAARAGHPFLIACVENICRAALDPEYVRMPDEKLLASSSTNPRTAMSEVVHFQKVLFTSGPGMVTRTYIEQPQCRKGVKILYAYNAATRMNLPFSFGPYAVHRMTGSWLSGSRLKKLIFRLAMSVYARRRSKLVKETAKAVFSDELAVADRTGCV